MAKSTQTPEFGPRQVVGITTKDVAEVVLNVNHRGHLVAVVLRSNGTVAEEADFGAEKTILVREMLNRAQVDLSL